MFGLLDTGFQGSQLCVQLPQQALDIIDARGEPGRTLGHDPDAALDNFRPKFVHRGTRLSRIILESFQPAAIDPNYRDVVEPAFLMRSLALIF